MVAIPAPLLTAAALFQHWSADRLLRAQKEQTILEPLYHYTDASGLKGIIESQQIWFTSHRYLNDPSEIIFGTGAAQETIATVSAQRSGRVKIFCDVLADLFNVGNITKSLEYLVASFSRERDDLGQWRAYGRDGHGFALGLASHLFQVEEQKPDQKPNEVTVVYPVEYGRIRARDRYYEIVQKAADIFEDTVNNHEDLMRDKAVGIAFVENYAKEVIADEMIFVYLTSKHEAYEHEREVRLMMLGLHTKLKPYIETRVKNGELVAFVRHAMPIKEPGSIVEVVVGPSAGADAEHAVRSLLNSAGIQPTVPIRRSDIPYRSPSQPS
jgi:Protein of unknown function (DUF2971)